MAIFSSRHDIRIVVSNIRPQKSADTSTLSKLADEEGFEPPIRVTPYTRFRVARIQPLCHSSIIILFFYNNFILPAYQNARP